MKKTMYLILATVGLIIPYSFLIDYIFKNGFELDQVFQDLFSSSISTFFVVDIVLVSLAIIYFIVVDAKDVRLHFITIPIIITIAVGPSCGLPLYLYLREIDRASWTETVDDL